jgi:hypothetical protein
MRFGIAAKLGLLLAGVSMLAAGLTGFYAYQASRDMLVQSAKTELLTTIQVLGRRVALTREEVSRNLQVLAGHPAALLALQGSRPGHSFLRRSAGRQAPHRPPRRRPAACPRRPQPERRRRPAVRAKGAVGPEA